MVGAPSTSSGIPASRAALLTASAPSTFASWMNGASACLRMAITIVHFWLQWSGYWKVSPRNSILSGEGNGWKTPKP